MGEMTVLENDLTGYGLRRVHVISMGGAVDPAPWAALANDDEREGIKGWRYVEPDLDVHHLWLAWQVRELVQLNGLGEVMLWHVRKGESMSFGIDCASVAYWLAKGKAPSEALAVTWPKNSPKTYMGWVPDKSGDGEGSDVVLVLTVDERVPGGFVAVR
jgi:hypothetical protein